MLEVVNSIWAIFIKAGYYHVTISEKRVIFCTTSETQSFRSKNDKNVFVKKN
jgi:hypothetical protein